MMLISTESFKAFMYTCRNWEWKKLGEGIFFFFSFCGVNKVPVYFSFVEKGGRQLFSAVGCYLNLFALDD